MGKYFYKSGAIYRGRYENDIKNGPGEYFDITGKKAKGVWKNGKLVN